MSATSMSWKPIQRIQNKNLSDIQSEELAKSLDESVVAEAPVVVDRPVDGDGDLALALQLQQEFDEELHQLHQQRAQNKHRAENTKVILDSSLGPQWIRRDSEGDEEFYDEDYWSSEEFDEEEENVTDGSVAPALSNPATSNKPSGRLTKEEFLAQSRVVEVDWKTKHDADECGKRNTEYVEETHPQHNLGDLTGADIKLSNPVFNSVMSHAERSESRTVRKKFGKSEQATKEQVLDPKTRVLLFKLVNGNVLKELNGAISTGKESVVYHAVAGDAEGQVEGAEFAVKIFKTTLNEFKARAKYVEGEHRFRHQLSRQNPRKIIRLWAEKEMRNLKRAEKVGLRCPRAVVLKHHVLVMEFVGKDGSPAPKLVDANLVKPGVLMSAYEQCVNMMRQLYQECHLVHADLSEYNMLFYHKQLWFIDLAQAVEHDHPNALRFLRDDCQHVTQFFINRGMVKILSVRRLFEYIRAAEPFDLAAELTDTAAAVAVDADDAVWFNAFLPQRLAELTDPLALSGDKDAFHAELVNSPPESAKTGGNEEEVRKADLVKPTKEERKIAKKAFKAQQREKRAAKSE